MKEWNGLQKGLLRFGTINVVKGKRSLKKSQVPRIRKKGPSFLCKL